VREKPPVKQTKQTEKMETNKVKNGDVFITSWGYDQTNYDYIVVTKISPSGKTAICQQADFDNVGVSGHCNIQKPNGKGYGKEFRMKVTKTAYGNPELRGKYIFCGEDSKRFDVFFPHVEDETYQETALGYGH